MDPRRIALLVPAVDPGVTLTDIGLGPIGPGFWYAAAYIVIALIIATPLRILRQRRIPKDDRRRLVGRVSPMYPATARERWLATGVAISAGVTEEIKYRGLFVAAGVGVVHLPLWAAVLASSVVFGFAHRYQGSRGMIGTGFLGLVFAARIDLAVDDHRRHRHRPPARGAIRQGHRGCELHAPHRRPPTGLATG